MPENIPKEKTIMGRMRENPRYNVISMRISDEEREHLESLVQHTHKSVSDIMREAMNAFAVQLHVQDFRKAA
jgi:predicted DNA-binding protein